MKKPVQSKIIAAMIMLVYYDVMLAICLLLRLLLLDSLLAHIIGGCIAIGGEHLYDVYGKGYDEENNYDIIFTCAGIFFMIPFIILLIMYHDLRLKLF